MKTSAFAILVIAVVCSITLVYFTDSWAYHPRNTISAAPGDGHVVLHWGTSVVGLADRYRITMGNPTFDDGTVEVARVSGGFHNSYSYTIENLTNGVEYEFFVDSARHSNYYAWFNPVSATPGLPLAPSLTATESDGEVLLEWTQPDHGTGVPITDYTVVGRVGSVNPFWTIADLSASATSYTVTNVTSGVPYSFALQATGASGDKVLSNIVTVTLS